MAARTGQAVRTTLKQVKPILSLDQNESKRRVLSLYKAWYRQIPTIVLRMDIPKNIEQCRELLREKFMENKDVSDIRVVDLLLIKGQMELRETLEMWKNKGHVMTLFKEAYEPKPTDFLSKFLAGQN